MSDYREDSCSPDPLSGLSSLTHHCLLHAVEGIAPHGISEVGVGVGVGVGRCVCVLVGVSESECVHLFKRVHMCD